MTVDPHAQAWGWVAHLREGGTTPWTSYAGSGAPQLGARLPGAQQLELLRRINLATHGKTAGADGVVRASLSGRGQPEFGLVGLVDARPQIDPMTLSEKELLRVAASAVADALIVGGLPEAVEPPPPRRRRRHFQLAGDPWLAIPLRQDLAMLGHPQGGRRARAYVVGGTFEQLVVNAWAAGSFDSGPTSWETWLNKWVSRDRPPTRVDLVRIAARHAPRARSVDIVLDPRLLRGLLGVRAQLDIPAPLAAHAVELARRVAIVVGGLVSQSERTALLRGRLLPILAKVSGPRLAVPDAHAEWLTKQAQQMRASLTKAGYPVHGDWQESQTGPQPGLPETGSPENGPPVVTAPTDAGALKVAIALLGKETW
jgi:hypothetical protein